MGRSGKMSFFKKMKERLFKSSSKLDEGLSAIVDEGPDLPEPAVAEIEQPAKEVEQPAAAGKSEPGLLGRALGAITGGKAEKRRVLDDDMLEELEELLITSDMGVETSMKISARLAEGRFGRAVGAGEIKQALAAEVAKILEPVARPLPL